MVDLGNVAGVSVALILACLLKCAVEAGNVDRLSPQEQNLLYLKCVADCLLPSGLPNPNRYQDKSDDSDQDTGD